MVLSHPDNWGDLGAAEKCFRTMVEMTWKMVEKNVGLDSLLNDMIWMIEFERNS